VLGYADQHYWRALAGELSLRELVGVQLGLAGADAAGREARADELLERVGLGTRRDAHPGELSGGEQQRVALCAALAHRPRLLVADEPTGELDAAAAREVFALIAELVREQGTTALVVSHDETAAAHADRVVHVRDGRVSAEHVRDADASAIVVGRGGWLRLPEELLRGAGIGDRAAVTLGPGGLVVGPPAPSADAAGAAAADVSAADTSPDGGACVEATQAPTGLRNEADAGVTARASVSVSRSRSGGGSAAAAASPAPPPAAGQVVVEARGLYRRYGYTVALDGVSASFGAGRLTVVTGPSGSGKTTLLHLLAGLDLPDAGDVVVDGVALSTLDRAGRAELRRTRLAFIGQTVTLVASLGARENVELALALRGVAPDEAAARAARTLDAVGLREHAERPVAELSAGQRERAAAARALAARPLAVIADEPTARLDATNALALGQLLSEFARESGTAFVCATHDPLLIELADEELALGSTR
jgi:ABC-type lipoprotein export system ATPase subunit